MSVPRLSASYISRIVGGSGLPRYVRGGRLLPDREGYVVKTVSEGCTVHWETPIFDRERQARGFTLLGAALPLLTGEGFEVRALHKEVPVRVRRNKPPVPAHVRPYLLVTGIPE